MSDLLTTLSSYVPTLVMRRLATNMDAVALPIGEDFPAAIIFADITGFTRLAERLARRGPDGAEELSRLLNAYFSQMIEQVTAHGGDIVTFAGDGLLALALSPWLPVAAVAAALAFLASARGFQEGDAVPVIATTSTAANLTCIVGGILVFGESASPQRLACLGLIVAGAIGLKLLPP